MQEGMLSLMQMARTSAAIQKMKEARVPYLVVLTHPVYGGNRLTGNAGRCPFGGTESDDWFCR